MLGALSPSRAGDFLTCPLLYRFRTIDKLPEPYSPDAVRGTVVHKVLEDLFDLPAAERTPERAARHAAARPGKSSSRPSRSSPRCSAGRGRGARTSRPGWRRAATCSTATSPWRTPRRLEPAERELYVETLLDSRLLLRGFVDRIDVAPDGAIRVVDYKTGRAPGEMFEAKALFQMKFYALVIWRTRGVVPAMLQLVYLGSGEMLRYVPDEADLLATERKVEAIWRAIRQAEESGDWRPSPSRLCGWCSHQALCPAYGGTPPALPVRDGEPRAPVGGPAPTAEGSEPVPLDPERRLGAVTDADPCEGRGEVRLHGALADVELPGDLLVGEPLADQLEDLGLAGGELHLAGARADAQQRAGGPGMDG